MLTGQEARYSWIATAGDAVLVACEVASREVRLISAHTTLVRLKLDEYAHWNIYYSILLFAYFETDYLHILKQIISQFAQSAENMLQR